MENVSVKGPAIVNEAATSYTGPLAILTTLFFMWGSLTSLNDVLIPYAQHVFKIELAASMLIQTAFFSAYFIFSIPAAKRSEEHTSELQSRLHLVCRLLLEKKKKKLSIRQACSLRLSAIT